MKRPDKFIVTVTLVLLTVMMAYMLNSDWITNNRVDEAKSDEITFSEDWKTCRTNAWDNCITVLENFEYNSACENVDLGMFNYSENPNMLLAKGFFSSCKVMKELSSKCWNAQAELCDMMSEK